jgi:YD repeat-containing protein
VGAYTYAYDTANRLTGRTEGSTLTTYSYDGTDQLTGDGSASWTYDLAGNRTNTGYSTTAGNRISADGTYTYTYDAESNITGKTNTADGSNWQYRYDQFGHLTQAVQRNSGGTILATVSYDYDVYDNRASRTQVVSGVSTTERFSYDDAGNAWADLTGAGALVTRRQYGQGADEVTWWRQRHGAVR